MERNIKKIVKESLGKINTHYDMTIGDVKSLIDMSVKDREFDTMLACVSNGFRYGYVMGCRATKAELKKAQRQSILDILNVSDDAQEVLKADAQQKGITDMKELVAYIVHQYVKNKVKEF